MKEEIRMKILYPLKNPDLFRAYGKKAGGGVLSVRAPWLWEKRSSAERRQARLTQISSPSAFIRFLDLYIGESEKNLHRDFRDGPGQRPDHPLFR